MRAGKSQTDMEGPLSPLEPFGPQERHEQVAEQEHGHGGGEPDHWRAPLDLFTGPDERGHQAEGGEAEQEQGGVPDGQVEAFHGLPSGRGRRENANGAPALVGRATRLPTRPGKRDACPTGNGLGDYRDGLRPAANRP